MSVLVSVWTPEPPKPLLHTQLELEAEVGIERGSFTAPSLIHSVSTLIPALFYRGSSCFFGCSFNATHCPVTTSKLPVR